MLRLRFIYYSKSSKFMNFVYLFLSTLFVLSFSAFFNHINFTYVQADVNSNVTNDKPDKINPDSYLMNETNYFSIKYVQKSNGLNDSMINKTAIYDSNANAVTIEYNNSNYYKTLTAEEENLLKKAILKSNFFKLPSSYPTYLANLTDNARYNSYNLTIIIDNKTNSVYLVDREYTTAPQGVYLVKDKIERWFESSLSKISENPTSIITPTCGPVEGFNFSVMINGFAPNRIVHWELLDQDKQPTLLGYFDTNSTGGFNETSYVTDLLPGKYHLHLYDDKDNDAQKDWVSKEIYTEFFIPCNTDNNNGGLQEEIGQGN